jgi:hypothetical protein
VRSGTAVHVVAPKPTSAGRCGPKLQLICKRVDAHLTPYLDLELICGGTRPSGCRQRPPGPLGRGCEPVGGTNFSTHRSVILSFYSAVDGAPTINMKTSTMAPGGAGAEGPGASTTNVKTSTAGPREVPELKVRERPPPT